MIAYSKSRIFFGSIILFVLSAAALSSVFLYKKQLDFIPLIQLSITIPEGYSSEQIAERFKRFKNFDTAEFLKLAKNKEGYLFPDTYFFTGSETEEKIIKTMKDNFDKKVGDIDYNVLIMASLIEKELSNYDDRRVVSGILWKRLEAEMPLQVDAVFLYIIDKRGLELTLDDLKIDSPYNTYLYKGLPPTPIGNPGLDAIDAALNPKDSSYWYYLSDRDGNTHFTETFAEHKLNKSKYLR